MKRHAANASSIRLKRRKLPAFFQLTRSEAIRQAVALLEPDDGLVGEARYLIDLFQLDPEELTEGGLSYERLRALEQRAAFL